MQAKRSTIVYATIGILLIALAAAVRFVVVPMATKLPGNTNLAIHYAGTATMLNSKALQTGDVAHALVKGVPVTIDRRVHVVSTSGNVAIVADDATMQAGTTKLPNSHTYAVDRSTLEATTAPAGTTVEPATGLTVAFPIHPKKDDSYRYYDATTQATGVVHYRGTATRQGRTVGVYSVTVSGPVKSASLLATLPPALPKSLAASLAPLLPAAVAAKLGPALPLLADPVPLAYSASTTIDAYLDPQSGVAIDERIQQQVIAGVTVGSATTSLLPVLAVDSSVTPASQKYLAHKAATADRALTLIGVVVPLALLILGAVFIVIAIIRQRRGGNATPTAGGSDAAPNPTELLHA